MDQKQHIQSNRISSGINYNQDQFAIPSLDKAFRGTKSGEKQYFNERPMTLNTWTQTSNSELGINDEYVQNIITEHREQEKALLEKIRILETDLHVKSELISQMQTAYEAKGGENLRKTKRQRRQQPPTTKLTKALLQNHNQHTSTYIPTYNSQSSTSSKDNTTTEAIQNEDEQKPYQTNEYTKYVDQEVSIQTHSMIQTHSLKEQHAHLITNNLQDGQGCNINYTIISDGSNNTDGEPIEIEIATEQNIQSPADSERLEICLAGEPHYLLNNTSSAGPNISKRFKICSENRNQVVKLSEPLKTFKTESKPLQILSTTSNTESVQKLPENPNTVAIGPNNTRIPTETFDAIDWDDPSAATRTLLLALFDRQTLATHSMTGRPSPAFKYTNKPIKEGLNQFTIKDIIFAVSHRCQVPDKVVRNFITTKCADETKMMKLAQAKLEQDKENVKDGEDVSK